MTTLPIIPMPRQVALTGGEFRLDAHTKIIADPPSLPEGRYLAETLRRAVGSAVSVTVGGTHPGAHIALRTDPGCQAFGREGYHLSVTREGVVVRAAARPGLFYGVQTLLQLLPPAFYGATEAGECSLPCVEIEDGPRFAWRGAMLDVSRRFQPVEFVLKFIDLLALHKMNVLHLHLTDDQGWRIEIRKYPRLTEIGATRQKTLLGRALVDPSDDRFDPASQRFDGVAHGGFYTQAQARAIVAYAAARHVTVVPEIEMPGHAQAAVAAYPALGCTEGPVAVSPQWGIHRVLFNPFEETIGFLQDVLAEIADVFPSPYIHVGGDEAVKTQWRDSPECQAFMRRHGLGDEEALQSYVIRRMDEFLTRRGRVLVGWDEILEGGLSPGAVVMSWRGEGGGVAAARQGHDVVMAPEKFTYLDYYQSEDRDAEPLAFSNLLTLDTVYGYEPVPAEMPAGDQHHILGAQAQLWSEYMPSAAQVEYQAFPRLSALAEVTWTRREDKDYGDFLDRLVPHLARLDALGVHYRPLDGQEGRAAP